MPSLQEIQRTLEVKIRPFANPGNQERPDQKGAARVYLSNDALTDLNLESGQPCSLWRTRENEDFRRLAIAWLTNEKSLSKKVLQMSKAFQEACGFKLGDDLNIRAAGSLAIAEEISLTDTTSGASGTLTELSEEDRPHWEWYIRENLGRAEIIFPGMMFKDISLRGPKRTFVVKAVNGSATDLVKFNTSSIAKILTQTTATPLPHPVARLEIIDVAGIDQALMKLNRFLNNFDRDFKFTWARRSCAVLIHGGHGTGKTFLTQKLVKTGWGQVHRIERDARPVTIRDIFKEAKRSQPSIIVLDDIDLLVGKEDMAALQITNTMCEELDKLVEGHDSSSLPKVLVLATTVDPGSVPLALRKRGRFRTDVSLPIPDATSRKAILKSLAPPIQPDLVDDILRKLGDRTHAYTPEDLVLLLDAACDTAEDELSRREGYYLTQEDIEKALLVVRPTAMHDIMLQPPSVRWDEIGGQDALKKALRLAVETPLLHPQRMKRIGASAKKGLLLYGPPGCSKTLSAQAMATEIGFNFFAVKGAELLNMYVGESERAVRNIFAKARAASPSIIFFDEIESIGSKRSGTRSNGVNVLSTLLNEMDGIETLKGVTVLAATNQPEALDLALLRPGRFDKLLYVAPPDLKGREEILRVRERTMDLAKDVDIPELARLTEGYSGAELVGICQTACDEVLEKCEETSVELQIHMDDFLKAIKVVKRQITPESIKRYERWAAGLSKRTAVEE